MNGLFLSAAIIGATCFQPQVSHVSYSHSYVAPYVAPQVLYFVGQPIRVESLVEKQKRNDPDYQEFLQFKAWKAGAQAQHDDGQGAEGSPPLPLPAGETVKNACAKCHGKATPAGGFFLDGNYGIEAERITKAIRAIASGEMPKDHELSKEERNQLLADLLSLEYQEPENEEVEGPE